MGRTLFFYGSLRHVPLLEIVLGRLPDAEQMHGACLPDYAACTVQEGPFPTLIPKDGAVAQGIVLHDLSDADLVRLNFYEGGFDYDLKQLRLSDGTLADVYLSPPGAWTPGGPWDLEAWVEQWAEMSCHAAHEVMGYLGRLDAAQVAARFGQIRTRAWSKVLARRTARRQGTFDGRVDIQKHDRVYSGFFALDEVRLRHDCFAGGQSPPLDRSFLVGVDAALVLPYDPARDRVALVEQMRVGPLGRGDSEIWQYEPVAGRIDPGESAADAAHRETLEEAGLTLHALEAVGQCYASPGTTTDFFHLFVGLTDLPDDAGGLGGLDSESEDIRTHVLSFDAFFTMAEEHRLVNAPLALLAYWLAHHRNRLRS